MSISVKTPCIGVCSTGIGDSVCRGCKRFAHEIIHWNSYSDEERAAAMARIESLLTTVVKARLEVLDAGKLHHQIDIQGLRCKMMSNDYVMAFEALRAFGRNLPNLAVLGLEAREPWQSLPVTSLRSEIDDVFFEISCAHYERYFPGCL